MRKVIALALLFSVLINSLSAAPVLPPVHPATIDKPVPGETWLKNIASMKIKELQKLTGKKFTLKEKIAFLLLKAKLKHHSGNNTSQGQTALIVGIISIGLLLLTAVIPSSFLASVIAAVIAIVLGSSAKKKDPSDKKAKTGKLLGWITLSLALILVIVAIAALSSLSWGG